jgi:hypothetical protein
MVRTLARATMLVSLLLPASLLIAEAPAGAAIVQKCTKITGTATFTPGLTNTPRDNTVRAKGSQTGCTPIAATGGSGVLTATIVVKQGSCAKLGTGGQALPATATTQWKNGKLSHYKFTLRTGTGANATVANFAGGVTSGLYAGRHVQGAIKFTVTGGGNCTAAKPIKTISFVNTKPFTISS